MRGCAVELLDRGQGCLSPGPLMAWKARQDVAPRMAPLQTAADDLAICLDPSIILGCADVRSPLFV